MGNQVTTTTLPFALRLPPQEVPVPQATTQNTAPLTPGAAQEPMVYQSGLVGPIVYSQDNSGVNNDITTQIVYTPQMFGAPATAQIIPGTANTTVQVHRGSASITPPLVTEDSITFSVWTQAAGGGLFGHHSGSITVSTSFMWYTQ